MLPDSSPPNFLTDWSLYMTLLWEKNLGRWCVRELEFIWLQRLGGPKFLKNMWARLSGPNFLTDWSLYMTLLWEKNLGTWWVRPLVYIWLQRLRGGFVNFFLKNIFMRISPPNFLTDWSLYMTSFWEKSWGLVSSNLFCYLALKIGYMKIIEIILKDNIIMKINRFQKSFI